MKNYLGISGILHKSEINFCKKLSIKYGLQRSSSHNLMLGILMNKSLEDKNRNASFKRASFLLNEMKGEKGIFKTIHYYSKSKTFAKEIETLLTKKVFNTQLSELVDGIQLNLDQPNPSEIKIIKETFPLIKIILQFNQFFFSRSFILSDFLRDYKTDYILIDRSRGKGKGINLYSKKMIYFYKKLNKKIGERNLGFAGGFSGENVYERCKRIKDILGESNFSIDAESNLRNSHILDHRKVERYIQNFMKFREN